MQDLDQIRIKSDNDGGKKIFNTISCIYIAWTTKSYGF